MSFAIAAHAKMEISLCVELVRSRYLNVLHQASPLAKPHNTFAHQSTPHYCSIDYIRDDSAEYNDRRRYATQDD